MEEQSDSALMSRALAGDRDAFGLLFDRHGSAVYRYAWALSHDIQGSHDIVQETLLVAWKKRRDIRAVSDSILPWLLATCRYVAYNVNRTRSRHPETHVEPERFDMLEAATDETAQSREELAHVLAAVSRLDPLDQEICKLCIFEGLSYKEAATQLHVTPTAVGKRLERARRSLRKSRDEYREVVE